MSVQPGAAAPTINVEQVVEQGRFGAFQFGLLLLCGLCLIMDGFDVQAMGYVAPAIIGDWGVSRASLGPVFGAGLFGMLLGSLALTPVGDRYGRRPVLIASTLFFALCMLATPLVTSIDQLLALRFITGFGLGSIMPNAMALVGEFSPSSSRVTRMMLVSCGFTVGAAAGGFVSAALIPAYGWHAVFWVGGAVPLLLGIAMLFWLPESIQFLVLRRRPREKAVRWLKKLDPSIALDGDTRIVVKETKAEGMPVAELFREGRAGITLLLWLISFMNLINLYFLSNWLPTLIHDAGYSTGMAVLIGTSLQVGGVVGTLTLGWFINRYGFTRVLGSCFVVACVAIALIGKVAAVPAFLFIAVVVAGFCVVGGQPAVNALAGTYYPTTLRSTGIGWALGIGRIGSVVGPVIGGQMIAMQWSNASLFVAAAVPALVSALTVARLHRMR
ncbi:MULTISPECIES: MFS transporter [unclassified Herbaspirillum]|uniref:MFS transporter n=1 Tax=unclassified Herbaspirillum TaxID=2624150 RepID=UPI0011516AFC|nr:MULTISPECIES: MFS transporter [unclassified Herbaspirillum]MBB5390725.1 AAHS family 4-hydroxybenzoate transporter-like MFS transporter [Herbaspirillum sp. SJZ102]TQK08790.1 AAHS family 4-hydroxybenzoate transporter-like MFS transporter [Herbaspirillum sp. SJZ130]TQK14523.1 AAHS family 4-hydroxybenzoate transporter-like MFS transporter [Herbaspirillum sp. SJZ106]